MTKEGLLERVKGLETTITNILKKAVGHVTGVVDEAEILVLKTQTTLLKTLSETLNGLNLPLVGDILLPTLEKTLEGIEATVDATVKKIEAAILGSQSTARPSVTPTTP